MTVEGNGDFSDQVKKLSYKYDRITDRSLSIKKEKDKKLKTKLKRHEKLSKDAVDSAAKLELLLTEPPGYIEAEGLETTWRINQDQISDSVDLNTRNNIFTLDLDDFGPYCIDYTRDGRSIIIGGNKGHVASFDWKNKKLHSEFHVREIVRDVKWLQNETMYAVAQKKYTYIYDRTGMELHCLRNHLEVNCLEYLPYHWLLASIGNQGKLVYQDMSTGNIVSEIRTKHGSSSAMTQNRYNSVLHLGHSRGAVTMWSPSMSTPLVKMFCHNSPILAVGVDISGRYMATTGMNNQLKLWDLRTYKLLNQYTTHCPGTNISISDMGMLSVSLGSSLYVWKDPFTNAEKKPYLSHTQSGSHISDIQFIPYEDVLGIGHKTGFSSIVVPGSGNPNFDSMEANPFITKKQRQESEVHSLLDKLQPEMIVLNPGTIATYACNDNKVASYPSDSLGDNENSKVLLQLKNKKKTKSTAFRRMMRKKSNIIDQKMMKVRQIKEAMMEKNRKASKQAAQVKLDSSNDIDVLHRFKKKST